MALTGRVDVHTHLLPGVDDGCASIEESLACARALTRDGYTHAYCTPHVWPNLPENNAREIRERVANLQSAFDAAEVGLTLLSGGENNLLSAWPGLAGLRREDVVTYGLLGRWVLFDFWTDTAAMVRERIQPAVRELRGQGVDRVLAHPGPTAALQRGLPALDR